MKNEQGESTPYTDESISKFNAALYTLIRLHNIRMAATESRVARDMGNWITLLDSQISEMISMVPLKESEWQTYREYTDKYYKLIDIHDQQCSRLEKKQRCPHQSQLYFTLRDFQFAIDHMIFNHGLHAPKPDDPLKAFTG